MKKHLLFLVIALMAMATSFGQTLNVGPTLCADPANNIYIVDPDTDILINIQDAGGNNMPVKWIPASNLYAGPSKQYPLPPTASPNTPPSGDVYFNSDASNQTFSFTGDYGSGTVNITIVTGGFEYHELCFGVPETFDDIDILGIPPANLNWYDTDGTTLLPNNTTIVAGNTYFVDLGFPGCSQVFPVSVGYISPLPTGSGTYNFCTAATWSAAGFNGRDGGKLEDLAICGENLIWYDAAGAVLPASTDLVDGTTYYVSQTVGGGCESGLLAVTVDEQECACFENPTFEDTALSSYEFRADGLAGTTFVDCNRGMFSVNTPVTPGAVNDLDADFAPVTAGSFDPVLGYYGITLPRTSPNGCSETALRLGNSGRAGTVGSTHDNSMVAMEADFIAGEVFSFDYSLILEDPDDHYNTDENPFFYVRVFDGAGQLVQEVCIVSYAQGCVFRNVSQENETGDPDPTVQVLYSEWSCIKLNTTDIQGQAATVEFFLADCGRGGHWGYGYIDNIFVGDNADAPCQDSSFGYVDVNPAVPAGQDGYAACSLVQPPTQNPECAPELSVVNPQFPITICGAYDEPVNAQGDSDYQSILLDVIHNGNVVTTLNSTTSLDQSTGQYCFEITQADLPGGPPYFGLYTIEVNANFDPGCGAISTVTVDNVSNGFKFCPTAGCLLPLQFCSGNAPQSIDLMAETQTAVLDGATAPNNYEITFYLTETDAHAGTSPIPSSFTFPQTSGVPDPGIYDFFVRLAFDYSVIGGNPIQDCYDVVPFQVVIGDPLVVPATVPDLDGCVDNNGNGDFDLTQRYAAATANVNPADVTVTYHDDPIEAQLGINEITTPTAYPAALPQKIYIRVANISDGCFMIAEFNLIGIDILYNTPTTLVKCDQDTNPQDAFTTVDLNVATAQITATFPNLSLTYYATQGEAQTGVGTPLPVNYPTADGAIWVSIASSTSPSCPPIAEQLLIDVVPAPDVFDQSLFGCSGSGGGDASFDLTAQTLLDAITGNAAGVTVASFHTTFSDADNNMNAIPTTQLSNYPSTGGDVFARVSDGNCHNVATVTLDVGTGPNLVPTGTATYELCDDGTGTMEFDLTSMKDDIINDSNVSGYTVTYYANQADIPGNPIINETNYPSTGATIIAVVEIGGCAAQTTFDLVVNPLPTFNPLTSLVDCDNFADTQDGLAEFDLTNAETQIDDGTGTTITFYDTQPKADAGVAGTEISTAAPYPNTTVGQTIFVRIENSVTGCYVTTTFILEAIPAPTVTAPPAYEVCDGDDGAVDGKAEFNLPTLDATITGGATGVNVTYHLDQIDADAGTPTVTSPTSYSATTGSVFARVQETSGAGCYNTVEVLLTVLESPLLPTTITPLEACDPEGDNVETFNLTDAEVDIRTNEGTSTATPWTVTYYETAANRSAGITVTDETAFTNDPATTTQTVFYQVAAANGCVTNGKFDIVVNTLPEVNTPEPLIICDDGSADGIAEFNLNDATTQITGNNPNFTVTYYEDQADADAGVAGTEIPSSDLSTYENDTPVNDSVWIRIVDNNTGCVVVLEVPLEVKEAPTANMPLPYTVCDPDNDGKHVFDLPTLDQEITGGVAGVTVTYHETEANANNDVIDITTPGAFANTVSGTQFIYARVESVGVDCYVVVKVELKVVDSPQPVLPQDLPPLMGCDENGDGQYQFNLTEMEVLIEANETNPNDFDLEYYATQGDIPANPIGTPSGYLSGSGTIYVVVTGPNDCTKETRFELIVNALPVITTPQPLELCDVNNPGDEKEEFDLTQATMEITGNDPSINITYYQEQAAADAGDTSSPFYIGTPTSYINEVNNETIYIRAEDTDTGCVVSQGYTLTLIVNPLPSPEIPAEPLEICDADNDGFAEFILADLIPVIQNGELDVTITFHHSAPDADNGVGAIDTANPFGMNTGSQQTIFVRAENDLTGCYVTGPLTLVAVPTPEIILLEDIYKCDDDANGFVAFDLTQNTPNVIGNQDDTNLEVHYYRYQADAEAGTNAIDVPTSFTNTVNPQQIFVRIENTETNCIDTFDFDGDNSFWLYVEELPVVNDPTPLMVCDDDYESDPTEQVVFDLTVKEGEIAGQTTAPSEYEFTYYASQQDFQNNVPITDPTAYQNVENPQTIYITVVNGDTNNLCEDYTTLTITVQPLPSPSETDQEVLRLKQCDDDNDGVAALPFDLTDSGNLIAGGENVELEYYKTERAAKEGDDTSAEYITDPENYVNEPSYNVINTQGMEVQVIYVRVGSGVAGNSCAVFTQFEIMVVPAPELNTTQPFGYTLCEDGSSGTAALFTEDIARNLYDASVATPDPSVIVPLLDQTENADLELDNYTIHYYTDVAGTIPFVSGTTVSTGESIFVQVEYDDTGCMSLMAEVIITVEPRPVIPGTDLMVEICSDEPGGSIVTIDLTQFDADVNPGAPADTEVVYYENIDAYNNGDAPIDVPTAYTTFENPQEIIGVVRNVNTLCESLDYSTILIEVNPTPMVDISMYDGMVICTDSDPFTPVMGGDYEPITIETGLDETLYTFEWSLDGTVLPETGASILVTEPGTYTVTTTDVSSSVNTACTTTSSATIIESNPPEFMVNIMTESFSEAHTITITNVTGNGDYEFSVDQGPWTALGEGGSLTFTGLAAGEHIVYGRDKNGCGTTAVDASIIDYPKFVTPNGDGYNDTWNIIGISGQPDAKIYIFDRYGKLLKQLSPTGPGWDGTFNGEPVPSDDYWFRVEYTEPMDGTPKTFKANFTLKR